MPLNILFAARPDLPHAFGRIAPTLLVTIGHAGLLLGGAVNGIFSAAIAVLAACIITAIYRQLAGPDSEATAELFD